MAKILLVGDICAEKQYLVDNLPTSESVGYVHTTRELTGSKIINAGRILTIQNEVNMLGLIGNDDKGKKALQDLKKYNIKTDLIQIVDKPTDEVLVLTDNTGNTAIALFTLATKEFNKVTLNDFYGSEYIYTSTVLDLDWLSLMIENAYQKGIKVFLDIPNQQDKLKLEIFEHLECVIPNRHEAEMILHAKITDIQSALDAVSKLKKHTQGHAIITLDKDGCVVFAKDGEKPQHFENPKTNVVDVTAAGDIFRGILLNEYINSNDINLSVMKALNISAKSVEISGIQESIDFAINNLS